MELAFTEVFKFLEIFAEQNTHIRNSNNALGFIPLLSKTPDVHKIVSTPLDW